MYPKKVTPFPLGKNVLRVIYMDVHGKTKDEAQGWGEGVGVIKLYHTLRNVGKNTHLINPKLGVQTMFRKDYSGIWGAK